MNTININDIRPKQVIDIYNFRQRKNLLIKINLLLNKLKKIKTRKYYDNIYIDYPLNIKAILDTDFN